MRITNETHWSTTQIATLIRRVAQDELDTGQLKNARVKIKYKREGAYVMGRCHLGTPRRPDVRMTLMLPRVGPIDLPSYALIIAHELAHAKGSRHREMNKSNRYHWLAGWQERYAYAKDFPIEAKAEAPKPTTDDKRRKAHAKALTMVAKWGRKLKLAGTTLKKWQRKAKAAERRLSLTAVAAHA